MADEEKVENSEQVSEVKTEETKVEKPEIHSSGLSMNKPSDGILGKISNLFRGKETKETEEVETEKADEEKTEPDLTEKTLETEVKDGETEEVDSDKYEEIDPQLVDAGRRFGLSDDEIVKYSENDPLYLRKIMDYLNEDESVETKPVDGAEKGVKDDPKALKIDDLVESLSEDEEEQDKFKKILSPFVDKMNALSNEINQVQGNLKQSGEESKEARLTSIVNTANDFFDKHSEDFPELEKTEDLPIGQNGTYLKSYPAVKKRSEIWDVAAGFAKSGMSFSVALDNALKWYVGKNAGTAAETKLIKKLAKRQEKLTPKKQTKATVKKFANEDDRKADVVKTAKKKAGISVEE